MFRDDGNKPTGQQRPCPPRVGLYAEVLEALRDRRPSNHQLESVRSSVSGWQGRWNGDPLGGKEVAVVGDVPAGNCRLDSERVATAGSSGGTSHRRHCGMAHARAKIAGRGHEEWWRRLCKPSFGQWQQQCQC
jgi:hypothetical protein